MVTVPPSLTCTVLLRGWKPSSFISTVCNPVGSSMRDGVDFPVGLPSTQISAPFGLVSTCAHATRLADFSVGKLLRLAHALGLELTLTPLARRRPTLETLLDERKHGANTGPQSR